MIPPISSGEHNPPPQPSPFRNDHNRSLDEQSSSAMRYSPRIKILAFGILAGGGIGLVYSAVLALLTMEAMGTSNPFAQGSGRPFFGTFVSILAGAAPWFISIATLAAVAQALVRRGERETRTNRALLKALAQQPRDLSRHVKAPQGSAQEIVEPPQRDLNLELEPRTPRP